MIFINFWVCSGMNFVGMGNDIENARMVQLLYVRQGLIASIYTHQKFISLKVMVHI